MLSSIREGDVVTGRVIEVSGNSARVELGEGIHAVARFSPEKKKQEALRRINLAKADLASLSSMLQARWKSGAVAETAKPEEVRAGQVRSFRITKLDPAAKKIEVEVMAG